VHCADTLAEAEANGIWDSVGWWYQNLAEFTLEWELPHFSEEERNEAFPFLKPMLDGNVPIDAFNEGDMIVVGDVDRCFEKMCHYADLGCDELICYVQFGGHSHESVMKTIELIGKEVLPEIEKYTPKPLVDSEA